MSIPTLTNVDQWPTRKLPQSTFDTSVRTAMNQMSTMVSELNSGVIPGINAVTDDVNTVVANLAAIQAAPIAADAAANSAANAHTDAINAAADAARAKQAADSAEAVTGIPQIGAGDEGKAIVVKQDLSGYELGKGGGGSAGGAGIIEMSTDLNLTKDSLRKLTVQATVPGLKIRLPLATTIEQDGVAFTIANNGVFDVQVLDADEHTLGANLGKIPSNSARAFVLMDAAEGTWLIMELKASSTGGRIGEAGFIIETHTPVVFSSIISSAINSTPLSDTKVFVSYVSAQALYARVISIFGTDIIVGPEFNSGWSNVIAFSGVALSDAKVVVATYSSSKRFAAVLTISDTTITFGTLFEISGMTGTDSCVARLSENKVIVCFFSGNASGSAAVLTVSDTNITQAPGNVTIFASDVRYASITALSDSKVLVAYVHTYSNSTGTAIILSVSNNDCLSAGLPLVFSPHPASRLSAVTLSDSKVLVAYSDSSFNSAGGAGMAIVLSISDQTITAGSNFIFDTRAIRYLSAIALSDNKVLIAYAPSEETLAGSALIISITGNSLTAGDIATLNSSPILFPSSVALSDTNVLVTYKDSGNNNYGTSQVLTIR